MTIAYKTSKGVCFHSTIEEFIASKKSAKYHGKINLIFTSPPFPLNRKKKYGNKQGQDYINWISSICDSLQKFLTPDGSLVIEVGNSWEKGEPIMSTLSLEALLAIVKKANLKLCQQFIWHNTAKLPSPAEWVNVRRIRVKDSFTHIWWLSKTAYPKANNRLILSEYSQAMKKLLETQSYNAGKRPSEHNIKEESFLTNNGGAIPSNVLVASNTGSNSKYLNYCKKQNIVLHPARMPSEIPNFFIKFLTEENDLVLDPFGGSNTTGESAQCLNRKWIAVEANLDYITGSKGRFI